MPRRARHDAKGSVHHVMNRAVGRRPLFENEGDIRSFISCLVAAVRRDEIRVQAYTFMTTHFHLLLESVLGTLGVALRRVESEYVRRFNRRHDRDGPLVRGRFASKRVDHPAYWARVVRYIDDNPVAAGLVASPYDYPHGSAAHYGRPEGPHWLDRRRVEEHVSRVTRRPYDPAGYREAFPARTPQSERDWVEARILRGDRYGDPFSDLMAAAPPAVRTWLVERGRLADGTRPGIPVLDVDTLLRALDPARRLDPEWRIGTGRARRPGWELLLVGLLRSLCAESFESIARRVGVPASTAHSQFLRHAALIAADAGYADRLQTVASSALNAFASVELR